MPAPSTPPAVSPIDPTGTDPTPPANRAARRAKREQPVPSAARYRGSAAHPRPAQGRRIIPVRRTG